MQPVLPILDMLYSSRLVLEGLAQRYGRVPQKWPPAVVAQLRQRHELLVQRIQRVICSLSSASYFILGKHPKFQATLLAQFLVDTPWANVRKSINVSDLWFASIII